MMKKFMGAFVVAAFAGVAVAQPSDAQLTLGINGGYVSSTFTGDDVVDAESESGFNVGASLGIPLGSGRFAFSPGVYWVQKGAGLTIDGISGSISPSYLEIPVLVSVTVTPDDSPAAFRIFAGPQFSIEVGCDVSAESGGVSAETSCDDAGFEERQSTDFGAIVGGLVAFPVSERLMLQLSGGADFGLRTLDSSSEEEDVKNRAFFINAGVAFPLGS